MAAPRLLMLAPIFAPEIVGGHPIVLNDLIVQLRAHGWEVLTTEDWQSQTFFSGLSKGQRWPAVMKAWLAWVPKDVRRVVSQLALPLLFLPLLLLLQEYQLALPLLLPFPDGVGRAAAAPCAPRCGNSVAASTNPGVAATLGSPAC